MYDVCVFVNVFVCVCVFVYVLCVCVCVYMCVSASMCVCGTKTIGHILCKHSFHCSPSDCYIRVIIRGLGGEYLYPLRDLV